MRRFQFNTLRNFFTKKFHSVDNLGIQSYKILVRKYIQEHLKLDILMIVRGGLVYYKIRSSSLYDFKECKSLCSKFCSFKRERYLNETFIFKILFY